MVQKMLMIIVNITSQLKFHSGNGIVFDGYYLQNYKLQLKKTTSLK